MDDDKDQEPRLAMELLRYYDDFSEFNDDCAFLCDAFAALVTNSDYLDQQSREGFDRHTRQLKQKVQEFKERLRDIRTLASTSP